MRNSGSCFAGIPKVVTADPISIEVDARSRVGEDRVPDDGVPGGAGPDNHHPVHEARRDDVPLGRRPADTIVMGSPLDQDTVNVAERRPGRA